MKTLQFVNVVIVGGGWIGLLMAKELGFLTSHTLVADFCVLNYSSLLAVSRN